MAWRLYRCPEPSTLAELEHAADPNQALDDIKAQVNAISTLPKNTERPVVAKITVRSMVMQLALAGATTEMVLKQLAEEVRTELLELGIISHVDILYRRRDEISVDVSEHTLRAYNLRFSEITAAINNASVDIPGGSIKADQGEMLLRSNGQRYGAGELSQIPLINRADGSQVTLGDVADVRDIFEDNDVSANLDGKPAMLLHISRVAVRIP